MRPAVVVVVVVVVVRVVVRVVKVVKVVRNNCKEKCKKINCCNNEDNLKVSPPVSMHPCP